MSKRVDIPEGRLAGMEYSRGRLTLTILEGVLAGRMYVLSMRVLDTDEEVLRDLSDAARSIAGWAADQADGLAASRAQGRLM